MKRPNILLITTDQHRGDCLGFGPPSEVTLANETAAPCTYLVVLARS